MAPKKGKESLLELCERATTLGNSVSVRMLEYLSTVKNQSYGFRALANEFLEICRILWSIEAGLKDTSRTHNQLPGDMIQELDRKFRQTNDDFIVLNQMLSKFLENERKGGFGKRWRMMFADSDIDKVKDSLGRSRESLKMSALVFRWSLGDVKADASVGIGYTALAAALQRMNTDTPTHVTPPPLKTQLSEPPTGLLPPTPVSLLESRSVSNLSTGSSRQEEVLHANDLLHAITMDRERQMSPKPLPSIRSSTVKYPTNPSVREIHLPRNDSLHPRHDLSPHPQHSPRHDLSPPTQHSPRHDFSPPRAMSDDNLSLRTTESMSQIEDMIQEVELINDKRSLDTVRLKADPSTVPRWTPKNHSGANSPALKSALANAIQQKNHKMVEQLLDCGVPPDHGLELNLLREAIMLRDLDSVRLLLLFGADPNGVDKSALTPLTSATELSFFEAAKMLAKYGADPNLAAGSNAESPLAMAIVENKLDFVQLYLMYGGNANFSLEDGSTILIKAMNKATPKKLAELMLFYGADPNLKDNRGRTPLFLAIEAERFDLVTLLLDAGADPNLPGPKHMLWPSTFQPKVLQLLLSRGADTKKCPGILELATSLNSRESISILLDAGVNPNAKKDGVYTPLCTAIRDNRSDIVSLLLANGADPNVMASEYPAFKCVTHQRTHLLPQVVAAGADLHSPKGIIETAVAHNNKDALMYLLDQGVNPNDRTPQGNTALTTAIREQRIEFVDLLLAHGADPSIRGQNWPIVLAVKSPAILGKLLPHIHNPRAVKGVIEMAVVANELESVKLLLQAGVSVEDRNGGVFSPLTTAIREDRLEIVRYLLDEAGADVNSPGEHLPIIKAIRRCRGEETEIIEMLLAKGADINLMYRGWNAVLQAVENGNSKILRLLVERGGGVNMQAANDSGETVMDVVASRGWDEALDILSSGEQARQ